MLSHTWVLACARTLSSEDELYVITVRQQGVRDWIAPLVIRSHAGITRLELIGVSPLYEPSGLVYESDAALDALLRGMLNTRGPSCSRGCRLARRSRPDGDRSLAPAE